VLHALPISSILTWPFSYTWRRVQVMKLLIMHCKSHIFCFFVLL
jgi:hypothetical protein